MATVDPELLASINPRVRKSPFFDGTVAAGLASVTCYNHMWLPTGYGDSAAEYQRLTEGVSMWDVAAQRHIEVRGLDADELVQRVTAVDVDSVEPGSGMYAPIVDFDATLINDPILLRFDDGSWRFSIADSDIRLWIEAVARTSGQRAQVRELDTATMAIQGPLADRVLDRLGCDWASDLAYFERRVTEVADVSVIVSRSGWSNQGGYEFFIDDPTNAMMVWDAVHTAGNEFAIGPGGPNQSERIENVLLSYGTDTGFDANPLEVGLGDDIDLDGPDFIGRDALRAIRDRGPKRRLLGAKLSGDPLESFGHPTPVTVDHAAVGQLRIAVWSPRYNTNLGLALVDASVPAPDSASTMLPSGPRDLTLVELPFEDHL